MDPFEAPYWNFLQVLAWVYLRDKSAVRRFADADEGTVPRTYPDHQVTLADGRKEWIWENSKPPTSISIDLMAARDPSAMMYETRSDAVSAIRHELTANSMTCLAKRTIGSALEKVPALDWLELRFSDEHGEYFAVPTDTAGAGAVRWHGFRFMRSQVLALWPDPLAKSDARQLAEPWLQYEWLGIETIIDLARSVSPTTSWPPDLDNEWQARLLAVDGAAERGELVAIRRGEAGIARTIIRLGDLQRFTISHDGKEWDWLRDFCRHWAETRGEPSSSGTPVPLEKESYEIKLDRTPGDVLYPDNPLIAETNEAKPSATRLLSPKDSRLLEERIRSAFDKRVKSWDRDGPFPTEGEDQDAMTAAAGRPVPREMARRIRREVCQSNGYDDTNWLKRGPRVRDPAAAE